MPVNLRETDIDGAWIVEPDVHRDERGSFVRTFDHQLFVARGFETRWAHFSLSTNDRRGTLRGLHFQASPHEETKLVQCLRGAAHDVIVDLRRRSPSYGRHLAVVLEATSRLALYVPPGVAHGFQTLEDDTVIGYHITPDYAPDHTRGVRFDDPAFGIAWPLPVAVISARDRAFPDYRAVQ